MTNYKKLVDFTGPELPFFYKREGIPKIDQSIKMPRHRLRMGVAGSYSSVLLQGNPNYRDINITTGRYITT